MKKYVEKFISEDIEIDVLPFLTEMHLQALGVAPLGARLKLLNAIKHTWRKKKKFIIYLFIYLFILFYFILFYFILFYFLFYFYFNFYFIFIFILLTNK